MMTTTAEEPKKFHKRDALREIEKQAQARWEKEKPFEIDAPKQGEKVVPKFLATFPYPYMNGRLHLGHSFSLSKVEFAVGYERLKGKKALFPFGFHCTGMPIKACADKLKREVEMFGKDFSGYKEQENVEPESTDNNTDAAKQVKKHGKVASKSTGLKYQFQIMQSMGVPTEEIHLFADAKHWLYYFPPLAKQDLKEMGVHVDWRRSFITTDVNPYYDSFIRWQFNKLRTQSPPKVQFGERYTIYSPLDGQACMDHDRSVGEGVGVQEYTGIKLQVLLDDVKAIPLEKRALVKSQPVGSKMTTPDALSAIGTRKVYLVAATLRPETMYGQTNCYVGPEIEYGVYAVNDKEAWVCTERAAKNMAWQGLFSGLEKGVVKKLLTLKGWDLVGMPLKAPLAQYEKVYTLPMENVLVNKGTGVVTSVPSDSPDDYVTMMDLQKKSAYYNVQLEWVQPFLPPKAIIKTPNYGDLTAVKIVEQMKIQSQKDKTQLALAKEAAYKEGFYNGTIIVGEYAGKPVQEAKPLIRKLLIDQGSAFAYCEPDGLVISRSNDECVVTLADQWYMDYGEAEWKKKALECLAKMETFGVETRNAFEKTLDWLGQWACSRSFGLGSRLPWDPQWLIESLSDSTIYMAYYTVAHLLHGSLDGSKPGPLGIKAEEMTDAVWDYIMDASTPVPTDCKISKEKLDALRGEFQYFYPLDLRCSGKDLVSNHLTFFIYNHVAIYPPEKWPKGVRSNGHLLLNNEKMSKSTGNFLTLSDAVGKYGADAMRFALADAGDGLEDANFLDKTADMAILRLHTEKEWMETVLKEKLRSGELQWHDRVFIQEIKSLAEKADVAYHGMLYREALKVGFFDLQNARNEYRKAMTGEGLCMTEAEKKSMHFDGMHVDVVKQFMEIQALIMTPLTPHWSEYIWTELLGNKTSVMQATWPVVDVEKDESLLKAALYLRDLVGKIRSAEEAVMRKKAKKGGAAQQDTSPKALKLKVALTAPEWQSKALEVIKSCFVEVNRVNETDDEGKFNGKETALLGQQGLLKDKRVMPFVAFIKKQVENMGEDGFALTPSFDELDVLKQNTRMIQCELSQFHIHQVECSIVEDGTALPGQPAYELVAVEN